MKPKFKGTPGPWKVCGRDKLTIEGADGSDVGQVLSQADSSLIAAAPELLEALQKTNDLLKDLDNTHTGDSRYADFAIQYSENRKLIEKALEG